MKFKYLGTAAAEGWPGMFCTCDNCKRAIAAGGKNIRTRSQAIVDDKLLIDFPADTYMHVLYSGLDLTKVKNCIITHSHSDHLYPADLGMRRNGFAYLQSELPLTFYATEASGKKINDVIDNCNLIEQGRALLKYITPFVPFSIEKYNITPLKADHAPLCNSVFYIISDGEKTILYAHDTGYFPDETWHYLKENKPKFDFVSLDCTLGVEECSHGHMGIDTCFEVKKRLIEMSCAGENTKFCINHFSHNGRAIYDELVPIAQKYDFLVSYDGMVLEI